jgi:Uri superfamily endonuclease
MKTYIFAAKNSSTIMTISAETEEEAWEALQDTLENIKSMGASGIKIFNL